MKKKHPKIQRANSNGTKSDVGKSANIRHLTRIITYLSEVDCDYSKQIRKKTLVNSSHIKGALLFLLNHKIIFIYKSSICGRRHNVKYYALNPFFKK